MIRTGNRASNSVIPSGSSGSLGDGDSHTGERKSSSFSGGGIRMGWEEGSDEPSVESTMPIPPLHLAPPFHLAPCNRSPIGGILVTNWVPRVCRSRQDQRLEVNFERKPRLMLAPGPALLSLWLSLRILRRLLQLQPLCLFFGQENEEKVKGKKAKPWTLSPLKELSKRFQDVTSAYMSLKR